MIVRPRAVEEGFEDGLAIEVQSEPMLPGRVTVYASHPGRPGVVVKRGYELPLGAQLRDVDGAARFARNLPELHRQIVAALWYSDGSAYEEFESFDNAPVSINALKARKNDRAADWAPRDALVETLREIDNGTIVNCDAMVICWRANDEGSLSSFFTASSPDIHVTLGMLSRTDYMINADAIRE